MRDYLSIHVNGKALRVNGADAFMTLSDFLRRRRGLIGTKVVCAEGDCGSCSVLIGRIVGDKIQYTSVCSCIQLMLQLDAAHVVTIEGLRDGEDLNAIQKSMVAAQGTQCGFCTPGFVVSLYQLMHEGKSCDDHAIRRGLVGNLCRCTGYDSIVRAALSTDRAALKSLDALYPHSEILESMRAVREEEVLIETGSRKFYKPTTLKDAVRFRAENPDCLIVSGATDIGVQVNKRVRRLDVVLATAGLSELRGIKIENGFLKVGACASLTELENVALKSIPELGKFLAWFGSPLIKNAGTLAGNIANGSPIGDTLPPLMVLGAEVKLAGAIKNRTVPLEEFYTGYRKTVMAPDELITSVQIPIPAADEIFKLYKVSRRLDLDISTFSAAIWMRKSGGVIDEVRIAFGGVGPTVVRLTGVEEILRGNSATLDRFEDAARAAREIVKPISDVRGSEDYRRALAGNILLRFWHETFAGDEDREDHNGDGSPDAPRAGRLTAAARSPKVND